MNNIKKKKGTLNSIRREIQIIHLILIITVTILLSGGGTIINVNANDKAFDQNLQDTAELITRLYHFLSAMETDEFTVYMDSLERQLRDVDVISIVNKDNIRLYHTNHELIHTVYDGTIPDFSVHSAGYYTENDIGPSGPQRRTYAAIYDEDGVYHGFIMTIMLRTSITSMTTRTVLLFLAVTIAAILIELAISGAISERIKRRLLGYEPDTFSSMFRIRENILESIYDGIVAIDGNGEIQFVNAAARKLLGCSQENDKLDGIKEKVFAEKFLSATLADGKDSFGRQEKTESGTELLIDSISIKEYGTVSGVVGILHDRTEYTKLMEELAGTKYLIDSMRANNHDFTNKLHVILGLIQIGEYDKAVSYIENISIIQRETLSTVMKAVDNASFAALLIGKIARASECNVRFILKEGIRYVSSDIDMPSEALVTIAGNLIDNALDSMNMLTPSVSDTRELSFGVYTNPGELLITVDDTGCGIPESVKSRVFENGFSTKGSGRGVGLYHTKQLVENLGGMISFESQEGVGTSFFVTFRAPAK